MIHAFFGCKNTNNFNKPQKLRIINRKFCGLLSAWEKKEPNRLNNLRLFVVLPKHWIET